MKPRKKIIVVGSGPGGSAAAMLLAAQGHQVLVYEKQDAVGGRNRALEQGGFRFDMGPTFLSMAFIAGELFAQAGRDINAYLQLTRIDPMYTVYFADRSLAVSGRPEEMKRALESLDAGESRGYEAFMKKNRRKLAALAPLLQRPFGHLRDYLSWRMLCALPFMTPGKSVHGVLAQHFNHEYARLAFSFQTKYLGMSPWQCPGIFSILSFMEHEYGIHHPVGGVNRLSTSMMQVAREHGALLFLGSPVREIWIEAGTARGVLLENGDSVAADEVVINADFGHAASRLIDPQWLKKYHPRKLQKKHLSCSTFMLYLGLNRRYHLPHHNIVIAEDYLRNIREITDGRQVPEEPSLYVQNACVSDSTLAPPGKSTLYILAPVPNNRSGLDWPRQRQAFRDSVLSTVQRRLGIAGLEAAIEVEKCITPHDWEQQFDVYRGATFSLGHQLSQMLYFRPHNRFEDVRRCWLVGGGTHPGTGLPTILQSARIVAGMLQEKYG